MNNREARQLEAIAWRYVRTLLSFDKDGDFIREDAVQEALLAVLEMGPDDPRPVRFVMYDTIKNFRDRYRERGYKVKVWQNSWDEIVECRSKKEDEF